MQKILGLSNEGVPALIVLAGLALANPAFGEVIGGPSVTARVNVDGAIGDVYIFNGNFTVSGAQVTSFQFFNNDVTNNNWITPLILSLQSGRTYQITGVGQSVQNTGAGLQTYAFTRVSGSASVANASYTFGWWEGNLGTATANTGVVQFDGNGAAGQPGFGESCATANTPPCNFASGSITPGTNIAFANDYNSFPNGGNFLISPAGRNYSIQFTTNGVPPPPPRRQRRRPPARSW